MKETILNKIRSALFLDEKGSNIESLLDLCRTALQSLALSHRGGAFFPPIDSRTTHAAVEASEIPYAYSEDPARLLASLGADVQGAVRAQSPYAVRNVIPQANFIYAAAHLSTSLHMLNAVSGENAAEGLNAELACASALSKLAGYDHTASAGVFTFSGTGTRMYGHKMGLMKAVPEHARAGIPDHGLVVIGSKASHYSQRNVMNWLGIGIDAYVAVPAHPDQTMMIDEFENACRKALEAGKKIACIELSGGTTSNMAIDDIEAVCALRDSLVEEYSLVYIPHIHVDSVIGWVYLNFKHYDFSKNILGFSSEALRMLEENFKKISKLALADSFGIDFHKTGFVPYTSSLVLVKKKEDLERLGLDFKDSSPLFHDDKAYNPGMFTLETSRSCANIIATWKTLQALGQEGYQVLIGHAVEMALHFREAMKNHRDAGLWVSNKQFFGSDVYVRCCAPGAHEREDGADEEGDAGLLERNNRYTSDFYAWFLNSYTASGPAIAIGKTNAASFTAAGQPLCALRVYVLNPATSHEDMAYIAQELGTAKRQYDALVPMQ